MSANLSGAAKENGRQMRLGIDLAFNRVNDAGGVNGRMLKLIVADDGYEPARTAENMKTALRQRPGIRFYRKYRNT